ncbi:MAG: potassium channel family protein [Patescibacteria group bacterium]
MFFIISLFTTLLGLIRAAVSAFKDPEFRALAFLLVILLVSGMIFYHEMEGWRWLDSLYFSVITLTTIGYGDLTPHTDAAKIFTMIYIFMGLGTILGFVELLAKHAQDGQTRRTFPSVKNFVSASRALARKGKSIIRPGDVVSTVKK